MTDTQPDLEALAREIASPSYPGKYDTVLALLRKIAALERTQEQRCIKHAAYNAESECAFCDVDEYKEDLESAEARCAELEEKLAFKQKCIEGMDALAQKERETMEAKLAEAELKLKIPAETHAPGTCFIAFESQQAEVADLRRKLQAWESVMREAIAVMRVSNYDGIKLMAQSMERTLNAAQQAEEKP